MDGLLQFNTADQNIYFLLDVNCDLNTFVKRVSLYSKLTK